MRYFLVVFDRGERKLVEVTEFDDADSAVRARFDWEAHQGPGDIEVVVLGAEDEAALVKTHGRYFGEPIGRELTGVG